MPAIIAGLSHLSGTTQDSYIFAIGTVAPEQPLRRPSPLECERLMGWEPGWTETGIDETGNIVVLSVSHRYKLCGNGAVANVVEWLGIRYLAAKSTIGEGTKDSW